MSPDERSRSVMAEIAGLVNRPDLTPEQAVHEILALAVRFHADRVCEFLVHQYGLVVQNGPFAGLTLIPQWLGSAPGPKLVGCYEAELHPLLAHLPDRRHETVVNIGCGEGYYAVGLARMLPAVRVFAFDLSPVAQDLCRHMAAVNGVADRVHVEGECTHARLNELARPRTRVFCDIEGAELHLLDPARVPNLAACDILVEMHDFIEPTTSQQLATRFAATHHCTLIGHAGRNPYVAPSLSRMGQFEQMLLICEYRPGPTPWAFLTPLNPASPS
jgi:SAM-dependent methyltransferase